MTDDIVTRLKKYLDGRPGVGGRTFDPLHPEMLIAECADEIECLRGEVRRWVRFSNDDANKIERLRAALQEWDALIRHQYSGSQEAMSDMTYAAQRTAHILYGDDPWPEPRRAALAREKAND